ncbi:MAG: sulfotransferase domain-containing protein [Gammaproteobacteria bacterium]|nr:sulfotransferase domain-containing protein [Gammaproteobacteria bacterium]
MGVFNKIQTIIGSIHSTVTDTASSLGVSECVCLTIRKAGTNFLSRAMGLMDHPHYRVEHLVYLSALKYVDQNPEVKVIVMVRDPRDVCVSGVYWRTDIWKHSGHQPGKPFLYQPCILHEDELKLWNQSSFDEKLMLTIQHKLPFPYSQILTEYDLASYYAERPNSLVCKFEDLVGAKGGGDDELQRETIKKMADFLGLDLSKKATDHVVANLFGASSTFRKGQIGSWVEHFKAEHHAAFDSMMGHLLEKWGYSDVVNT